eukprot:PITA_25254
MSKAKTRSVKLKATKYCIMNNALYWKDLRVVLLNRLTEDESKEEINDFHKGDCGGHLYWKTTANNVLRAGYYWPTLFANIYKAVMSCHECQVFQGEINPSSSAQHKWILTATDYFTKWIEEIPTRNATDSIIIQFLETNILSRFGCPHKIITYNATTFKSKKTTELFDKYNINLGHFTTYYLQGNGLEKSSNRSLINIIKKLLEAKKKNWNKKLINALWADRVSSKKSLGLSPFQIVYGLDTIFPTSLAVLGIKLLQEEGGEENDM